LVDQKIEREGIAPQILPVDRATTIVSELTPHAKGLFFFVFLVLIGIVPHLFTVFAAIFGVDGKDVEPKTPAITILDGAAPKAVLLPVAVRFDPPFDAVTVVLFIAVDAMHYR
jgi:hypothetical protein